MEKKPKKKGAKATQQHAKNAKKNARQIDGKSHQEGEKRIPLHEGLEECDGKNGAKDQEGEKDHSQSNAKRQRHRSQARVQGARDEIGR
jgi:hypothetical protein